jgi:hypothetical protein
MVLTAFLARRHNIKALEPRRSQVYRSKQLHILYDIKRLLSEAMVIWSIEFLARRNQLSRTLT